MSEGKEVICLWSVKNCNHVMLIKERVEKRTLKADEAKMIKMDETSNVVISLKLEDRTCRYCCTRRSEN